ncbi:MAG: branched-chain amino acid transporter permease, partial [Rhizobacter sp.]|nr:branched-chain amino acid transporter permease [Rhizobacter sp.]
GAVFGLLATRRQGLYFSMITLALAQLLYFGLMQAPFTNKEDGYQGVPRGRLLGLVDLSGDLRIYYFVLVVVVLAWLLVKRIVASPFGEVLRAVRDNEPRATSLGYDVRVYKVMTFTLSAGLAGLAGGLKTLVFGLASLSDASWHLSGDAVIMTILGGAGTIVGPVFGASIVVLVQYVLTGEWIALAPVVMGVIFMVCVLTFRRGIVGELLNALRPRGSADALAAPTVTAAHGPASSPAAVATDAVSSSTSSIPTPAKTTAGEAR